MHTSKYQNILLSLLKKPLFKAEEARILGIPSRMLQAYLKPSPEHRPDLPKLSKYAKVLRINITPYIMAITT